MNTVSISRIRSNMPLNRTSHSGLTLPFWHKSWNHV